jgi:hypothetical protein
VTLRLLTDVHVPSSIVRALRGANVDVLTAKEDQSDQLVDSHLLNRATAFEPGAGHV